MTWLADLRTMAHTVFRGESGGPLAQRLEAYYRAQASHVTVHTPGSRNGAGWPARWAWTASVSQA